MSFPPRRILVSAVLLACLPARLSSQNGADGARTGERTGTGKVAAKAAKATGKRRRDGQEIAVVDLRMAAGHTKAFKKGLVERMRMKESFTKELKGIETDIGQLKNQIETMVPSPERTRKQLERETLIGKLKMAEKLYNAELDRQSALNGIKVYSELDQAVAELAGRRGIRLVFRKHSNLSVEQMLKQQLVHDAQEALAHKLRANSQRIVIYHAKGLDLTEDLIKYLKAK